MSIQVTTRRVVLVGFALGATYTIRAASGAERATLPTAEARVRRSTDGLALFDKMMPVWGHMRCVGCHSGIDPFSNAHLGGPVDRKSVTFDASGILEPNQPACLQCHDAQTRDVPAPNPRFAGQKITVGPWRLAPSVFSFVGKNDKAMCDMMVQAVKDMGLNDFLNHLRTDTLIGIAFVGTRGGAEPKAASPPMSRKDFVDAAKEWTDDGPACTPWEGLIRQEERFQSAYDYRMPGTSNITVDVAESAVRTATITLNATGVTQNVKWSGQRNMTITMTAVGADGKPCESKTFAVDNHTGSASGSPESVRVKLDPNGAYSITVHLAGEKSRTVETRRATSTCGGLVIPMDPPTSTDLDWEPWQFTIQCPPSSARTFDVKDCNRASTGRPHVYGSMEMSRKPNQYQSDPQEAWFHASPVSVARSDDGKPLAVAIKQVWDIKR